MSNLPGFDELFLECVRAELQAARKAWPGNDDMGFVVLEEAGELAKAMLHHKHHGGHAIEVWKEAVQTAAMAMRIATEGDANLPYRPTSEMFDES